MRIALLLNKTMALNVFCKNTFSRLTELGADCAVNDLPDTVTVKWMCDQIADAQIAVTCWGSLPLTAEVLSYAPELQFLAHAAGSLRPVVTEDLWERNIRVTCASPMIADDVAETTLGIMITQLKKLPLLAEITRNDGWNYDHIRPGMRRLNGLTVGIVGASFVGRKVIELLKPFNTKTLVFDPYLSDHTASTLGVSSVSLDTLFSQSDVVSIHAPSLKSTYHMIGEKQLSLMKDGSLLINNARGKLVDESALIAELKAGRIYAALDVTDPEPPLPGHPFRSLSNVFLTPHLAGGQTVNGRYMQGNFIVRQIERFLAGKVLDYEVTQHMMSIIA